MQTEEQAQSTAYSCVLSDAERHMNAWGAKESGHCEECEFCTYGAFVFNDITDGYIRKTLQEEYGICSFDPGSPDIVKRKAIHSSDYCFQERE